MEESTGEIDEPMVPLRKETTETRCGRQGGPSRVETVQAEGSACIPPLSMESLVAATSKTGVTTCSTILV